MFVYMLSIVIARCKDSRNAPNATVPELEY
jgi:hypothetical protein